MTGRPASLEHAERQAQTIGRWVTKYTPQGWGFVVCLTQFGEGGDMTYVSDAERPTVVKLLRELADKLDGKGDQMDVKYEHDPVISEALELLSVVGHVLSCPGVQVNIDAEKLADGPEGRAGALELAEGMTKDFEKVMKKALDRAEELIAKHRPELLELEGPNQVPDGMGPDEPEA